MVIKKKWNIFVLLCVMTPSVLWCAEDFLSGFWVEVAKLSIKPILAVSGVGSVIAAYYWLNDIAAYKKFKENVKKNFHRDLVLTSGNGNIDLISPHDHQNVEVFEYCMYLGDSDQDKVPHVNLADYFDVDALKDIKEEPCAQLALKDSTIFKKNLRFYSILNQKKEVKKHGQSTQRIVGIATDTMQQAIANLLMKKKFFLFTRRMGIVCMGTGIVCIIVPYLVGCQPDNNVNKNNTVEHIGI